MSFHLVHRVFALAVSVVAAVGGRGIADDALIYRDAALDFAVTYPSDFVVRPQDVSALPRFTPMPVASIFFMNPVMAHGALAGREPPDLEVRVYDAGKAELAGRLADGDTSCLRRRRRRRKAPST